MLERALNRIMLVVIASRFPETEKPLPLKTEKCHNIGCLYSISGFLMALTAALKAQIAAWYKALQEQIPDFIPRAPQRQMIADVAKTLAGEEGRHLAIEAPTGVGKTLSYLIPGIAIAREEQKTLVVSTANVALQDQIYSKDLPLLKKIIPDLKFTAAFGRGRYVFALPDCSASVRRQETPADPVAWVQYWRAPSDYAGKRSAHAQKRQ